MVFTEKNKQTGLPYLNPNFITYLTMSKDEQSKVDIIPDTYVTDYSINNKLLFDAINNIPEDKNIICLAHYEEYKDKNGDSISYRYKSTGNMVDQYITPEGKFEIVLYGKSSFDEKEKKSIREFVTNDDGVYPAKSPIGMFDLYIPNDLGLVVDKIAEYYE